MTTRLGRYLQTQLDLRGMNAVEFSRKAGMRNPSHIYQILRGERRDPGSETLRKIAVGLGMSYSELTAAIDEPRADDPIWRNL